MSETTKARVCIVGGGIAGLEEALALADLAGQLAEISLISPDPDFTYKPLVVEEPFTSQPPQHYELEPLLAELGIEFVREAVTGVRPEAHTVELADGSSREYDRLAVCVGGRARRAFESAEHFWSSSGNLPVDELIERAARSPSGSLALIVPPGTSWPLPLYELALMSRRRAEELGHLELRMQLFTAEDAPLAIFGPLASGSVADVMRARRIEVVAATRVIERAGVLRSEPGDRPLDAQVAIALPTIEGPAIDGLPADAGGFIPIDEYCRVIGVDDVYAAGDGTSFPVKQGGLATQQADCVAEQIAAGLGAPVRASAFEPVLRGQLLTGMESLNMRHQLSGGSGEGVASLDYLWWPPQKVSGRYLSALLAGGAPHETLDPPFRPLEVEVSWPHEWHATPAAYDAERPPG